MDEKRQITCSLCYRKQDMQPCWAICNYKPNHVVIKNHCHSVSYKDTKLCTNYLL